MKKRIFGISLFFSIVLFLIISLPSIWIMFGIIEPFTFRRFSFFEIMGSFLLSIILLFFWNLLYTSKSSRTSLTKISVITSVLLLGIDLLYDGIEFGISAVSYTHLTLPTKA